jgi:hypothetical protein
MDGVLDHGGIQSSICDRAWLGIAGLLASLPHKSRRAAQLRWRNPLVRGMQLPREKWTWAKFNG